jgi:hypothetical protein
VTTDNKTYRHRRKYIYVNIVVKLSLIHMTQLHGTTEIYKIIDATTYLSHLIHAYKAKDNLNFT